MQKKVKVLYAFVSLKNLYSEVICTFKMLKNNKLDSVWNAWISYYKVTLSDIYIITLIYLLSI